MSNLMPFRAEDAEALNTKLSSTMFRSTQDFISFYNSGLINKAAEEVASLASEVDATFKNVKLQGRTLVFISENEVYLEELLVELKIWEVIAKVKTRLQELVNAQGLSGEETVYFPEEAAGQLHRYTLGEEAGVKLLEERFFKNSEEELGRAAHRRISSLENNGGTHYLFQVSDFLNADDSFVSDVYLRVFAN